MGSHHRKQRIKRRRRRILRVSCVVTASFCMFFGTGELFQGSSVIGVALIGLAVVLLLTAFSIRHQ